MADFMGLSSSERRYFFRLVELERAQTEGLRNELMKELNELRETHHQLKVHLSHERIELTAEDQQTFYSSWIYIAVRLITSIPNYRTAKAIGRRFGIPEEEAREIIEFLLRTGLCIEGKHGLEVGPSHMHLDHRSPLIRTHHANWRLKAMNHHAFLKEDREVAYSLVSALSGEDALRIRSLILDFAQNVRKVADPSPSETLYCLNIDWLEI